MSKEYPASIKVLPVVYLGENDLLEYEESFGELMQETKTKIDFNYERQYFHIQGRSQSSCDKVAAMLKGFLAVFNELLAKDFFKNTYCNMERFPSQYLVDTDLNGPYSPAPSTPSSQLDSPQVVRVSGRSLSVLEVEDDKETKVVNRGSRTQSIGSQHSSPATSPSPSMEQQQQGIPQYYRGDTESEGDSESEVEEFSGQFVFAKNIRHPNDVLTGPPLIERKYSNNLKEIETVTGTECALVPNSRVITITGPTREAVDDAIARFVQLQTLFKRRGRMPTTVPCIHPNPTDPRPFRLYFADLERYRHKNTVFASPKLRRPLYTLLPVYTDPRTKQPSKPTDLVDIDTQRLASPLVYQSPMASSRVSSRASTSRAATPSSPSANQYSNGLPAATWGSQSAMQVKPSAITPEAEQWKNRQQIVPTSPHPTNPVDDFPTLPTKPAQKPSVQPPGKGMKRRVMRISNQQAPTPTAGQTSTSVHDICRDYNLHNAKEALTEGLDALRGIPGEVKFGAKFGKVLWGNLSPAVQSKMWQFQDIKDLVMKEHKVVSLFNNVTTVSEDFINSIYAQFPPCNSISKMFEIHAMARNQPSLEYQPVIMTVNPGTVDYQKVILRKHRISEIDWVSLDRKFDFQMYLNAEELGRKDVKPYTTFLKTLMIDPTNYNMTFDNVENFLSVTHVYFKQTTKHRLHFPFVLEITRVERVPLEPQTFNRTSATIGTGDVWYDCELFCTSHNEFFKRNMTLKVGKVATWTLSDIFGENDDVLMEYLKCALVVSENLEVATNMVPSS